MRRSKEVGEVVLRSRAPSQEVTPERQHAKDPAPLKVKEVTVEGRRYMVCLNEEERRKDARDRATILEALREQLRRGDKSLIGNKGYRRFLKIEGGGHFSIDDKQVAQQESYDGLFRATHRHRARHGNCRSSLQNALDGRGDLPHGKVHARNAPHLSQKR